MSTNPDEWLELLNQDDLETVTVSKKSLRYLVEHAKAVETNRDELFRLLMGAHQAMAGPGKTDQKLRKVGRLLNLTRSDRTKADWEALAERYWRVRFGTPPDMIGGPIEPMTKEQAELLIEQEAGIDFERVLYAWRYHKIKVNTRKRHWTWREPKR